MLRSAQAVVEEWPAVRLAAMALLVFIALGLLEIASRIEPSHPGAVFINGRVPCLRGTLLASFGPLGQRLSKNKRP